MLLETGRPGVIDGGVYEINSALHYLTVAKPDARLVINSLSAETTISYVGAPHVSFVFYVVGSIAFSRISGLTFDGRDKANGGMTISSTHGRARMFARGCHAKNLKVANYAVINAHGVGIRFAIRPDSLKYGGRAQIRDCSVSSIMKETQSASASLAAQGIAINGFEAVFVQGNRVETVLTDDTVKIDANGINITSRLVGGVYQRMTGDVSGNIIRNCAGRFIKLQVDGDLCVHHNTLELSGPLELITSWRGIDSQIGSCRIEDNTLYSDDQWTGGR